MNALNVCISLVFVFLIFSIVVSGVQEWWAQFRSLRGKWLRLGLLRLIDDDALFVRVLRHPLVGDLCDASATTALRSVSNVSGSVAAASGDSARSGAALRSITAASASAKFLGSM